MIRLAVLGITLLACSALPASGQTRAVSPAVPSDRPLSKTDQARDMMNRYGICIAKAHRNNVKRVLALPDREMNSALRKLATDDCLIGGRLQMSEPLFRGALYRALYIREFGSEPSKTLITRDSALESARASEGATPMEKFSICVVGISPQHTREFVIGEAGSRAEKEAITALRPALADCLPPKEQVSFTPWGLQASLSEALYKWTVARAQSQTSNPAGPD